MTKNTSLNFSFFRRDDGSQISDPEIEDMFERGTALIDSLRVGDLIDVAYRWHGRDMQKYSDRWDRLSKHEQDAIIEEQTYHEAMAKHVEEASKCKY